MSLLTFVCILLSFREESTDRFLFKGTVPTPDPVIVPVPVTVPTPDPVIVPVPVPVTVPTPDPVPFPVDITEPTSLLSLPSNFFRKAVPVSAVI